jgi:hypothetical protein
MNRKLDGLFRFIHMPFDALGNQFRLLSGILFLIAGAFSMFVGLETMYAPVLLGAAIIIAVGIVLSVGSIRRL